MVSDEGFEKASDLLTEKEREGYMTLLKMLYVPCIEEEIKLRIPGLRVMEATIRMPLVAMPWLRDHQEAEAKRDENWLRKFMLDNPPGKHGGKIVNITAE